MLFVRTDTKLYLFEKDKNKYEFIKTGLKCSIDLEKQLAEKDGYCLSAAAQM